MIRAYDKVYLDKARTALGRMLDFAVYDLKYDITEFFNLFIKSGVAKRFETGDFAVIVGMSGVELAYEVLEKSGVESERIRPNYTASRSEEFYQPYHEMDIRQFVDKVNAMYKAAKPETNLKLQRQKAGLSQCDLADLSGIPVRTIQQYEQRQKSINKAQAEYLVVLAKVLCCEVGDLMEKTE